MNPLVVIKKELEDSSKSMAIFLPLSIGIGLILLGSILLILWKLAQDDTEDTENSNRQEGPSESQATESNNNQPSSGYGGPPTYDQVFSIS